MAADLPDPLDVARDLLTFIDAAPTPFHAVAEAARRLDDAGYAADGLDGAAERGYVIADGALVAWHRGGAAAAPFRIIGAHTDSPNLRIRPQPDTGRAGWQQLGVEVYGGSLVNSWLDRDLGLAGRVAVRSAEGPSLRLLRIDRPILRVPQLAIHLDREVNDRGLLLNKQLHLTPVWALGSPELGGFRRFLADELELDAAHIVSWDLMAYDVVPGTLAGRDDELVSASRLDNLCSCHAAIEALIARPAEATDTAVVALFDHEEVGSQSARGAAGAFLGSVLERLHLAAGGDRAGYLQALASSMCLSTDMAHATHPNYPDRHEPDHQIALNGGPVVKINTNQRYATDASTQARFEQACADAGVPVQRFVSRNDMPCGSTIGPATAAQLAIPTADAGVAQLGMHSIRELCGSQDPALFQRALVAWLT